MKTTLTTRVMVLATCLALAATAAGMATSAQELVDYTGCITSTQVLVKVEEGDAPASPCSSSETEISWSAVGHTVARSTISDLVPGAETLVEEVEPGVLRLLDDGVRDTRSGFGDIVAGTDGSIWVFRGRESYRLGDEATHTWRNELFDTGQDSSEDIEVGPDGTLWWADRDGNGLKSFDGTRCYVERATPKSALGSVDQVEVLGDGTVLASWRRGDRGKGRREVALLGDDGWEVLHRLSGGAEASLGAAPAGQVSLMLWTPEGPDLYLETSSKEGVRELGRLDRPAGQIQWMDVGSDGTIWISYSHGGLARHDDGGWTEFDLPAGLYDVGGIQAAPDGSVWSATCGWDPRGCELLRFDGERWARYLGSLGLGDIDEIAFAPDGTTWTISGPNALYAVLPEAIEG